MRHVILLGMLALILFAQSFPLSENNWKDKDFVKRFLGEYGVLTKLEPKMKPRELKVMQELTKILAKKDSEAKAAAYLEQAIVDLKKSDISSKAQLVQAIKTLEQLEQEYQGQLKAFEAQEKAYKAYFEAVEAGKKAEFNESKLLAAQEIVNDQQQKIYEQQKQLNQLQARKDSDYTALYFVLGQIYLQDQNYKKAVKNLHIAIKNFPNFYRAYKILLIAYMQNNELDKAYKMILKVLELKGGDGDIYGFLGFLHLQKEQYFSAARAYEMALLYFPDNQSFKKGLLQALIIQEDHQKSIALAGELLLAAKGEQKSRYLLIQANAYLSLDQNDKALEVLKLADFLANDAAKLLLAKLYLEKGLIIEAMQHFEELFKLNKKPSFYDTSTMLEYLFNNGETQLAQGFMKSVKQHYKQLNSKEQASLNSFEAQLMFKQGQTKQAVKILKQILNQDPLNANALLTLIEHHAKENAFLQANLYCDRLYENEDYRYEALITCANVNVSAKDYKKAKQLYSKAYQIQKSEALFANIKSLEGFIKR